MRLGPTGETIGPAEVDFPLWLSPDAAFMWEEARHQVESAAEQPFVTDNVVLHWIAIDFLATYLPVWLEAIRRENPIAVRERFRCAIPGCTRRDGVPHHLRFRSRGGSDDAWNLLHVCFLHHIEGIHQGYLRVAGRAPDDLTVELGIRRDGSALERFVRYERPGRIQTSPALESYLGARVPEYNTGCREG